VKEMKAFCEECRDYVEYQIKEIDRTKEIKGRVIHFTEKIAYCSECGGEIFVSELRDENLAALDSSFRLVEGLITVPEIHDMLETYYIGKRPMSLLLGWGETTLTRFLNGDIPSKTYSDLLRRMHESPEVFLELLMANKDKITEAAFKKSFEAINRIINDNKTCSVENKIESASNYIIKNSVEITPLALQKLLYFTQAFHKVFTGNFIFDEDCEAWVHGPVYREIYFKYKDHGYNPIEDSMRQFECFDLTQNERDIIDAVINYFGCYSGKVLENMTHFEAPWKETRNGLSEEVVSNRIIGKEIIERYFKQVYDKFNMLNIADIKDYSDDLFEKIRQ
jgi:putative zinc finger/helix-turn-helix YgiT family protein